MKVYMLYERLQDGRDYYDHILGIFDDYEIAVQYKYQASTLTSDCDIVEVKLNEFYGHGLIKP